MTKVQTALLRRRSGTFSAAEYDRQTEEIGKTTAQRFSRGSVNPNLLTEEALDAEKAERRKQLQDHKSD